MISLLLVYVDIKRLRLFTIFDGQIATELYLNRQIKPDHRLRAYERQLSQYCAIVPAIKGVVRINFSIFALPE